MLAVRLGSLYTANTDLFFDEAQYWFWSQDLDFGYFSKPPMIAWVIRASTELCGTSEFCVRLASPFLHSVTAIFIFLIARALYGNVIIGIAAALAFVTIPGVTLSSTLISTDVPLLMFWSMALYAFVRF